MKIKLSDTLNNFSKAKTDPVRHLNIEHLRFIIIITTVNIIYGILLISFGWYYFQMEWREFRNSL